MDRLSLFRMNLFSNDLGINDAIPTEFYANKKTKRRSWTFKSDDNILHELYLRELPLGQGGLGAQSWDAAVILTKWLASHASHFKNKVTLELGAGCALPSIFISRYTKHSIATEYMSTLVANEEYGAFINSNDDEDDTDAVKSLKTNSKSSFRASFLDWSDISAESPEFNEDDEKLLPPLQFNDETQTLLQERFFMPHDQMVDLLQLNDTSVEMVGLGSELIYSPRNVEPLFDTLSKFLSNKNNVFYHILSENRDNFVDLHKKLTDAGFLVKRNSVPDSLLLGLKSVQRDEKYLFFTYYSGGSPLFAGE